MVGAPSHPSESYCSSLLGRCCVEEAVEKKMTHDFHKIHSVLNAAFFLMFFKIFNMLNFDPKQAGSKS